MTTDNQGLLDVPETPTPTPAATVTPQTSSVPAATIPEAEQQTGYHAYTGGVLSGTTQPQAGATSIYQSSENPDVTVESLLTSLLDKENSYLTQARSRGQQYANSRGLLNSSIAGTASESAAIEAALPIAQQDAQYYQNRALAGQQGEIDSSLSSQQANQQGNLYQIQGQISAELAQQGYDQDKVMKQMDINWNKLDLQSRLDLDYARLDQDKKTQFDNTANTIGSEYMEKYLSILVDPSFATTADKQSALDALYDNTQKRFAVAATIAGVQLEWGAVAPDLTPGATNEPAGTSGTQTTPTGTSLLSTGQTQSGYSGDGRDNSGENSAFSNNEAVSNAISENEGYR